MNEVFGDIIYWLCVAIVAWLVLRLVYDASEVWFDIRKLWRERWR